MSAAGALFAMRLVGDVEPAVPLVADDLARIGPHARDGAPADDAPPVARHRRGWTPRCDTCRSTSVRWERAALVCNTCRVTLAPPSREAELATSDLATRAADPRRPEVWDEYSRPHPCGGLLAVWGRSTDRADGEPPRDLDGDGHEEMPPGVRAAAIRGEADEQLDAAIAGYVALTAGLVDAIDRVKPIALQLAQVGTWKAPKKRPRPRPAPPARLRATSRGLGLPRSEVLVDVAVDEDLVVDADRCHFLDAGELSRSSSAPPPAAAYEPGEDWYYPRVVAATSVALLGCVRALALLAVNALRARGVEYLGSTEQVRARLQRPQPFSGYRHALAAAFGMVDHGESSPIPHGAVALHALPQGMVFGKIACRPSRSYSAHAREPDTGAADVAAAILAARVGARTYSDGGRVRHEPGRPLTDLELELVRLVDAGLVRDRAQTAGKGRRTKVSVLAIEPLHPREALAWLRAAGRPGVPRTEREARILLANARRAIRRVLEARGLIPGIAAESALDEAAGELGERARAPRPSFDPFATQGP